MRFRLLTKQLTSQSLKRLAAELGKRLNYKVWRSDVSKPTAIEAKYGQQVDKKAQYKWFKDHNVASLEYTDNQATAKIWAKKCEVVVRKTLNGSEGAGIVIAKTPEQIVVAPVYTKYKKKATEFRVHIFKDKVVAVTEKRLRTNWEGPHDSHIRNTANGYVFCHNDVVSPPGLDALAVAASKVTSSDFKGVDIGFNKKANELFVIEVNSAPGIEGSNIKAYADEIITKLKLVKAPVVVVAVKKKLVAKKKKNLYA